MRALAEPLAEAQRNRASTSNRRMLLASLSPPETNSLKPECSINRGKVMQRLGVVWFCTVALSACIPMMGHEYDIEGPGEKTASGGCSSNTEALLTTHITPATSIVFWGSVDRLRPNHRTISVSFTFSNDETVLLTKSEVLISSKVYSIPRIVPITTVRRSSVLVSPSCDPPSDSVYQQPDEPMQQTPGIHSGEQVIDSVFAIDIAVSGDPTQITVQLPPVSVNGQVVDVPAVTFLRKTTIYLPAQIM
jgi:hypothetical protein